MQFGADLKKRRFPFGTQSFFKHYILTTKKFVLPLKMGKLGNSLGGWKKLQHAASKCFAPVPLRQSTIGTSSEVQIWPVAFFTIP